MPDVPSLRTQLQNVLRKPIEGPTCAPGLIVAVDLVEGASLLAARQRRPWSQTEFTRALTREAPNLFYTLYKAGRMNRFGPVYAPGVEDPDYLRYESQIVYAFRDGPSSVSTPNVVYDSLSYEQEQEEVGQIARPGRRTQSDRNDFEPWLAPMPEPVTVDMMDETTRLRALLEASEARLKDALAENQRLHAALQASGVRLRAVQS